MSLYIQPSPTRVGDTALPTAPDKGVDVHALIDMLTNRIAQAERRIEYKVDSNALAKIILTDRDIVLMGDQVSVVGQLNIVDWVRNVSGNITGGIDPASMTRITGGKVQTGIIESMNWSTTAGSQINLDTGTIVTGGSLSPKFSVSADGVLTCQSAVVTGTLTAGSFIQSSVRLDDAFGLTLGEIAAGSDIQAALTAGVTNILAGVGSDFRLDVNTTSAYAIFKHKDAVFLGTAPAGTNKPALGISASGIAIGYNRASDGAWITSVAIDASGNAAFLGTVSAGSIITNSVTVDGVTLATTNTRALNGHNIQQALTVSGTTILAGVLVPTNTGALKTGSITWDSVTGALTGGTGIAITEWGIIGAAAGVATFSIAAATGAAIFKGDITGGSNLDVTGRGVFGGAYNSGGYTAALHANMGSASQYGIVALAGSAGIGVVGVAGSGDTAGIQGTSGVASVPGIWAVNSAGSVALKVTGSMTIDNAALVTNLNAESWNSAKSVSVGTGASIATFLNNNKPGSASSNTWWTVTFSGTTYRIPVWT